jgi:hypothetical protein
LSLPFVRNSADACSATNGTTHASQEHLIRNELIVNQKQICFSGHAPQTIHYVVFQQGHSIGIAWPKDDGSHHISCWFNITYHTVNCVSYYLLCNEIVYRPFVVPSDGKM